MYCDTLFFVTCSIYNFELYALSSYTLYQAGLW